MKPDGPEPETSNHQQDRFDQTDDHERVVQRYFAAMRQGPSSEEEMLSLFTDDAVYDDPFDDGEPAVGIEAIGARLRGGWENSPPDLQLQIKSIVVEGDRATSRWECRSTAFEGPVAGRDDYQFRDGLIAELIVSLVDD